MKKCFLFIIVVATITFIGGCAQNGLYYFGDYSQTLYKLEKNQDEESLVNHQQELEKIIAESESRTLKIPPGIYAELGYINLKANNTKQALEYFDKEAKLYPESKYFMERLINSANVKRDVTASAVK
jgi:hypothetical protein